MEKVAATLKTTGKVLTLLESWLFDLCSFVFGIQTLSPKTTVSCVTAVTSDVNLQPGISTPASTLSPQKLNDSSPGSTAAATRGQQATAVGEVTEIWNHYHQDDDAGDESQLTCCLWWMSADRNCANTPDWVKHTAVNFGFLVLCNKLLLWSRPSWRGLTSEGREDNLSNAMNPKHLTQITGGGEKKKNEITRRSVIPEKQHVHILQMFPGKSAFYSIDRQIAT